MSYRLSFYIKMSVLLTGASWRADLVDGTEIFGSPTFVLVEYPNEPTNLSPNYGIHGTGIFTYMEWLIFYDIIGIYVGQYTLDGGFGQLKVGPAGLEDGLPFGFFRG